ncbi:MAG TPA: TIGR03667 family PPOX class F420-dependent oxidoreductase [Acidimicrobiia bacterium]|nr:TIGR03667 family PPOX class F420-dependent oxidoreductase [Acidimicrobiia bacterium]
MTDPVLPPAKIAEALDTEPVAWLTTVRRDGQPQASPVWFVYDDAAGFTIYSRPDAPRLRNIGRHPRVSLNLDSQDGGRVISVEGIAVITDEPPSDAHPGYREKYLERMTRMGYTPERFAAEYSSVVRVAATRWRVDV